MGDVKNDVKSEEKNTIDSIASSAEATIKNSTSEDDINYAKSKAIVEIQAEVEKIKLAS